VADESDFSAVVEDVQLLAQTELAPALMITEVERIVRETARARTWTAATALGYGAYVIPTAANLTGRRYRVVEPGTTGATESTWSEVDGESFDDNTVTFEEAGPFSGSVYDKRKAVEKCLVAREAKMGQFADVGPVRFSQMVDNIRRLRASFAPLEIA
jgi:hypothetical protein